MQKWERILQTVKKAEATASKNSKGRADLSHKVLAEISHALSLALNGLPVDAFSDKHAEDVRPRELYKVNAQDEVIIHVIAVREGLIEDPQPNVTSREYFLSRTGKSLDAETIRNWVRNHKKFPIEFVNIQLETARNVPDYRTIIDLRSKV
ncbi:MAG: hypothetical protein ACU0FH_16750 [Heliomarina sp.]|uniref:hypothetical protein n=1 Tax=Heliomarina sp. TaxID=2917556 RepID=UPI004058C886